MHASCTKEPTGSPDEHCGHKKRDYFSTTLVSPLEADCSSHFTYRMDGSIHGSDARGYLTVRKLHLDSALLDRQRKALIDDILDIDSEEDLQAEISRHLNNGDVRLGEFYTMVEYLHRSGLL